MCFTGIVHTRKKAIQDVEQIWRSASFHHLLSNGSSAVNGCRQTKNITISTVHLEKWKGCVLYKEIIKTFVLLEVVASGWNTSPLFIILLSPVEKSGLVWIRREICTDQAPHTVQVNTVRNSNKQVDLGHGLFHQRKCYSYFGIKCLTDGFVFAFHFSRH